MHTQRLEPMMKTCRKFRRGSLRHGVCMFALVGALSFSTSIAAQDNPVVDISDPNVSIDLSVLNDGGLSPQMGAPLSSTGAAALGGGGAYQAPGKDMPVSTLYVRPTSGFKLPPQTKSIETKIVKVAPPEQEPEESPAEAPVAQDAPEVSVADTVAALPPAPVTPPPAPEPTPAPVEMAAAAPAPVEPAQAQPATPEPVAEVAPAPATPAPTPPAPTAPAETVAALTPPPPAPQLAPDAAPQKQPMALKAEAPVAAEPTPAPAQAAAPTPAPPPAPMAPAPVAESDETQTAPMPSKTGGVVLPLPPKPEPEVASLPPATGPLSDGDSLRIVFDADTSKLAQSARDALLDVATKMQSQDNLRLQLLAYAGTADTSASAARRLSLSRALAVRSFLIENGVRSTRIDVRALGNKSTDEVTERVDITVVER